MENIPVVKKCSELISYVLRDKTVNSLGLNIRVGVVPHLQKRTLLQYLRT